MRYTNIDTLSFTDRNGVSHAVYDTRPINTFENALDLKNKEGMKIDELIARQDLFGDGQESLVFAIADHNIVKLTESDFVVSKLKIIKIPVIEDEL